MTSDYKDILCALTLGLVVIGGGFAFSAWSKQPGEASPSRLYTLRQLAPQSGQPRLIVLRAYGERDARTRAVESCGDRNWLDETRASCLVLDDCGAPGVIAVSYSP